MEDSVAIGQPKQYGAGYGIKGLDRLLSRPRYKESRPQLVPAARLKGSFRLQLDALLLVPDRINFRPFIQRRFVGGTRPELAASSQGIRLRPQSKRQYKQAPGYSLHECLLRGYLPRSVNAPALAAVSRASSTAAGFTVPYCHAPAARASAATASYTS